MAENNSGLSLTQAAYISRQVVKYSAVVLVLLIVSRTLFSAFVAYWKATHPEPPPPPTVGFGILPSIKFPERDATQLPSSYELETATGDFPEFTDRANVFLMYRAVASLLDDENAKKTAASFGFVFPPESIGTQRYRFSKSEPFDSIFEINVASLNFELDTDFLARPELITNTEVLDQSRGVSIVKSALESASLLPLDVATASGDALYLKALGDDLSPALSFSDADYLQVDLNRTPIDGQYQSFTADGQKGTIHAILSGAFNGLNSIVRMSYNYQKVDYSQAETYPLRSARSAWQLLQSGEGYVAQKGEFETAVIREVELGYYESEQEQDYFQPIYVFKGDGGFVGYVPAVDPKYYQSAVQ